MSAEFWAGYISGAAGIVIGNPLDIVKVRLQAGQAAAVAGTVEGQVRGVGGWKALSRGEEELVILDCERESQDWAV